MKKKLKNKLIIFILFSLIPTLGICQEIQSILSDLQVSQIHKKDSLNNLLLDTLHISFKIHEPAHTLKHLTVLIEGKEENKSMITKILFLINGIHCYPRIEPFTYQDSCYNSGQKYLNLNNFLKFRIIKRKAFISIPLNRVILANEYFRVKVHIIYNGGFRSNILTKIFNR